MTELAHVAEGEARAVDDAGVILLVEIDPVALADQAGNGSQIHLEARGKGHGGFLPHERGQALLELDVEVQRAV